ncbi:EpsD family peptidyl-prolyl cis-trans isomerase [Glaciimonas sp. Gout2]|uniref:EpsD family peptidyl-prolyl cis-trans isomerase n=1 Tax=unclassified Glaciimonas TaxID=2644401 RepID=UPI002B236ABF|nr:MULTISPECIES: EpsD family peptidyl-prolyl cis-trans isomerase [unclassified Glaciimonas]MEB0010046.1 EpsD family peptidyl-prolyl cis-trans isomerase [Glaciimonas sp. Cout2]MEB0081839.1 EpsD family peptidyl-prolyl cis-trans isomerase [Glaciimonas sp. Gout2]
MNATISLRHVIMTMTPTRRIAGAALLLFLAATLSACGDKEKAPGQSLARVNGQDITVLQLNDELQRTGDQQKFTNKQILDGLIDRQLLVKAAQDDKLDRDPLIMQAIERSKVQILAQAYLQKKIINISKPSTSDIDNFYQKNPDLFLQRKQFELKELVVDTRNLSPELVAVMNSAKSLDEVATWLDGKKIEFLPTHVTRTSVDLSPDILKAMKTMSKGQLFTIKEGPRTLLIAMQDMKEASINAQAASPQIERFLIIQKNKEAEATEVARLHTTAKIEYLNDGLVNKEAAASDPVAKPVEDKTEAANHIDRGVAGLK